MAHPPPTGSARSRQGRNEDHGMFPTAHSVEFRRNDNDRRPPSRVLTPKLMGDPDPDRLAKGEARRLELQAFAERTRAESRHYRPKDRPNGKRVTRQSSGDVDDG